MCFFGFHCHIFVCMFSCLSCFYLSYTLPICGLFYLVLLASTLSRYSLFCADGTLNPFHSLTHSLVSSKLDCCNSLYSGISQANLNKLQRIQNSMAHVITNTSKYQHITPTLKKLHWLPIKQRIDYKLWLLTYKTLPSNNLHIFTVVFHFCHILFLQDLLIHSFFPFHMSDHQSAKGLSLSLVHDFGIHYLLIPEIHLYQYSVPGSKHTSSKLLSLPRLFLISLDCLLGFWFLLFSFYALSNDT